MQQKYFLSFSLSLVIVKIDSVRASLGDQGLSDQDANQQVSDKTQVKLKKTVRIPYFGD